MCRILYLRRGFSGGFASTALGKAHSRLYDKSTCHIRIPRSRGTECCSVRAIIIRRDYAKTSERSPSTGQFERVGNRDHWASVQTARRQLRGGALGSAFGGPMHGFPHPPGSLAVGTASASAPKGARPQL